MPGIAGIIRTDARSVSDSPIDLMVNCMRHEPFHKTGTHVDESLGVALGWVAHEGTFADVMPAWNERRDVCVIFTGENYADRSEIDALRSKGHAFDPDNAGYLPHMYVERGIEFLSGLNGCFSGVLLDLREGKAVLFNDRYGLGRIYHHESGGAVYFASEAKALLKVIAQTRRLDLQGFAEFVACGSALQNRTLFAGVSLLPGASAWTFKRQVAIGKERYFNVATLENQERLPVDGYYAKMKETFTRILPRYFRGKQRMALSLTGGLDSRMILAAAPVQENELPCYTFGGMYRESADVRVARRIAHTCKQPYTVIPVGKEFFTRFRNLAERSVYCSDGAMDVTGSVELYVNRLAREIAPVRLTGNYGSEILRGNVVFKVAPLDHALFDNVLTSTLNEAASTFAGERRMDRTSFVVSRQVPWYHYARLAVEQSQLTVRSPFLDNELVAVAYQAPSELLVNKALAHRYIADQNPTLDNIPTDRGAVGRNGLQGGRFAVFCQEFMPRVEYLFDYGMPQWLAKLDHPLAPLHLEQLFLGRQKFYHFRVWYRDELSAYIKEVLLDPRTLGRPYLNARRVEEIVQAHVKGWGNYTLEIHKLLTSELIQRQLIEQN